MIDYVIMEVVYINRNPQCGYSIHKVFANMIPYLLNKINVFSIDVVGLSGSIRDVLNNIKQVRNIANLHPNAIFHITGDVHYITLALWDRKTIVTVHDIGRIKNISCVKRFFYWILRVLPLQFASRIVFISKFAEQEVCHYIPLSRNKISIIPDSVSDNYRFVEKYFNQDNPTILHIGTRPHKNLSRTIEALSTIRCHLRIIGKISRNDLYLLEKYGINYYNAYDLSENDLLEEYKNADIINFPSLHEGFGMPIIEAQAMGRIVITSDISPMREVAGNGACLCDPYSVESIRSVYCNVLKDKIYRDDIISKGLKNVMQYRSEIVARKYFDLYNRLYEN